MQSFYLRKFGAHTTTFLGPFAEWRALFKYFLGKIPWSTTTK